MTLFLLRFPQAVCESWRSPPEHVNSFIIISRSLFSSSPTRPISNWNLSAPPGISMPAGSKQFKCLHPLKAVAWMHIILLYTEENPTKGLCKWGSKAAVSIWGNPSTTSCVLAGKGRQKSTWMLSHLTNVYAELQGPKISWQKPGQNTTSKQSLWLEAPEFGTFPPNTSLKQCLCWTQHLSRWSFSSPPAPSFDSHRIMFHP